MFSSISRKLVGAVTAMGSVVGLVLGTAYIGGVDPDILKMAVVGIVGLGGFQVFKQGDVDIMAAKNQPDPKTLAAVADLTKFAEVLGAEGIPGSSAK